MTDLITLDLIATLGVMIGTAIFLLAPFLLMYRAYVLRLKAKNVNAEELRALKARVAELEAQLTNKKVPERLRVLEEVVTSEDFDLKRKLEEIEKVA